MPMDYSDAIESITDDDTWMDAGFVAGGYLVPAIGGSALEGMVGVDLPDELYGIGGMAASEMVVGERMATVGSGLYVVDSLAQRLGVKDSVSNLGGA
jgi:hypothetical protein